MIVPMRVFHPGNTSLVTCAQTQLIYCTESGFYTVTERQTCLYPGFRASTVHGFDRAGLAGQGLSVQRLGIAVIQLCQHDGTTDLSP